MSTASPGLSASGRSRTLQVFLKIGIGLSFIMILDLLMSTMLPPVPDSGVEAITGAQIALVLAEVGLALFGVALFICTGVVYLMWVHRVARVATGLGAQLSYTPGWAVGWHFVPIANLVKPYQIMTELVAASRPEHLGGTDWKRLPTPGVIGVWWGLWIGCNVAGRVALHSAMAEGETAQVVSFVASLTSEVLTIGAALALLQIITQIDESLTLRAQLPPVSGSAPLPIAA